MNKVINGKMYNTETAKICAEWSNGKFTSDFDYLARTLYQKKNGEFFLMTETYSHTVIQPLTDDEAKEYGEEMMDGDRYVQIFGEVEE